MAACPYQHAVRLGRLLAGSMVGAFVSTAMAWQKFGNDTAYVDELMTAAKELYAEARKYQGSFGSHFRRASLPSCPC